MAAARSTRTSGWLPSPRREARGPSTVRAPARHGGFGSGRGPSDLAGIGHLIVACPYNGTHDQVGWDVSEVWDKAGLAQLWKRPHAIATPHVAWRRQVGRRQIAGVAT